MVANPDFANESTCGIRCGGASSCAGVVISE
jgi:hypothetical protein